MHHMRSVYYPFRRRPNVLTVHDLTPLLFPQWHVPEVRAAFRPTSRFARRCAAVIAVSENTRKDAHRLMKVPLDRIHTVHEAADKVFRVAEDPAQVMERLAEHGLAGRSFLLFVGTLEPRKNLPGLLRAFARLRELVPGEPPLLVLAGSKGWLYEPIFREIERLALAAHVRHIENANDETVAALMNAAVALVYPSYYEGFGLPPLEAMACGCPVITSNTSSLPEVVGDAGILANPDDVRQIAEAMQRVFLDANFREDLRRRGLRRAAAFSWERAAKQTLEVYEKVVHPT
jgi:glycosyltransferase involved in cell wall biosynthesis